MCRFSAMLIFLGFKCHHLFVQCLGIIYKTHSTIQQMSGFQANNPILPNSSFSNAKIAWLSLHPATVIAGGLFGVRSYLTPCPRTSPSTAMGNLNHCQLNRWHKSVLFHEDGSGPGRVSECVVPHHWSPPPCPVSILFCPPYSIHFSNLSTSHQPLHQLTFSGWCTELDACHLQGWPTQPQWPSCAGDNHKGVYARRTHILLW